MYPIPIVKLNDGVVSEHVGFTVSFTDNIVVLLP